MLLDRQHRFRNPTDDSPAQRVRAGDESAGLVLRLISSPQVKVDSLVIIKEKRSWISLLFSFKGTSNQDAWLRILTTTLVALVVTYIEILLGFEKLTITPTPFTVVGFALGIFLGFRNNAAYDRYWEGRKLWGALVNTSRSLTRQAYSVIDASATNEELTTFRHRFVKRVIAFVHALRHHLRDSDPNDDLSCFLRDGDMQQVLESTHRPLAILQQLGRDVAQARDQNWLHELNVPCLDGQLVELSNIMGACERIKNTPIPFTYTVLIHQLVALYCLLLPFGLISTTGVLTPIVVFLVSHAFFGLDAIGDEIEEPFGQLLNSLPLNAISVNIERNLLELIGEPVRQPAVTPQKGILL